MPELIALDTETELIRPGLLAPPMACVSWCQPAAVDYPGIYHVTQSEQPIRKWLESDTIITTLNGPYDMAVICAQHRKLMPAVFDAYDADHIRDIRDQQRLIDIANGELGGSWLRANADAPYKYVKYKYSLKELTRRHFGEVMDKGEDTWRLRYGELISVPLERWPREAVDYATLDARNTLRVDLLQHHQYGELLGDAYCQARANFALHLMSCRGIRTDAESCAWLVRECEQEIERCRALCEEKGLLKRTKKGLSKNLKAAREYLMLRALELSGFGIDALSQLTRAIKDADRKRQRRNGEPIEKHVDVQLGHDAYNALLLEPGPPEIRLRIKLTATGEVSLDADACKDSGDPVLRAYAVYTSAASLRKKVWRMGLGARVPLQTRYEVLLETGRTSSSAPGYPLIGDNFQNFRRKALTIEAYDDAGQRVTALDHELPGQRECIRARDGYVFCSVDLDNAEMRAMAQICLWIVGHSRLAEVLNDGKDCHSALAAARLMAAPMSYSEFATLLAAKDKAAKNARQFAKIPNFALLGGARGLTMIPYAKQSGIILTPTQAYDLEEAFHSEWDEVAPYHKWIRDNMRGGVVDFTQFVSGRKRGSCRYTAACNTGFQGLVADAAKAALLPLARAAYVDESSPFFGSYPVLFIHDEVIAELPEDRDIDAAAHTMRDIMLEACAPYFPDVPMSATPALMHRIYKDAVKVTDRNGRIIVWEPEGKSKLLAA